MELKRSRRRLVIGCTCALLALVTLWSYSSFAAGFSTLTASPSPARQNDTVTLRGRSFTPGEMVSVWITYPDFRVYGVADVETNADGDFIYPYLPDFLGAEFTPLGTYVYTARGRESGRQAFAELTVDVGKAPGTSGGVRVEALPGKDDQGSFFTVRGEGYGTEEDLAIWLRYPDGTVLELGRLATGPRGAFEYTLRLNGAPTGRYAFTGRGLRTGLNGIGEFELTSADLTRARGTATLRLRPNADDQRSYAIFEGNDFQPNEIISIWVTLPDDSTQAIGDVQASESGTFIATLYIGEQQPIGQRAYTAFGNISRLRAIATFALAPGGPEPAKNPVPDIVITGTEPIREQRAPEIAPQINPPVTGEPAF